MSFNSNTTPVRARFSGVRVAQWIFSFLCITCCTIVISSCFLYAIGLLYYLSDSSAFVVFQFAYFFDIESTASDYPFGILKLSSVLNNSNGQVDTSTVNTSVIKALNISSTVPHS